MDVLVWTGDGWLDLCGWIHLRLEEEEEVFGASLAAFESRRTLRDEATSSVPDGGGTTTLLPPALAFAGAAVEEALAAAGAARAGLELVAFRCGGGGSFECERRSFSARLDRLDVDSSPFAAVGVNSASRFRPVGFPWAGEAGVGVASCRCGVELAERSELLAVLSDGEASAFAATTLRGSFISFAFFAGGDDDSFTPVDFAVAVALTGGALDPDEGAATALPDFGGGLFLRPLVTGGVAFSGGMLSFLGAT